MEMNENVIELSNIHDNADYGIYRKCTGIWDQPGALDSLLDVVGSEEYIFKLTSSNFKKKLVWEEIAAKIEARGFPLGDNRCRVAYQKWLNLKKIFISALNKKSGKTPPWFDKLNEIYDKSDGKLLGFAGVQGEEDQEEGSELPMKKMKQEYLPVEEEEGGSPIQGESSQYVVDETNQVTYGDVIAIMQQLEVERREREDSREKREQERFDKLSDLLRQQNTLTEKLIAILNKQPSEIEAMESHAVLPLDSSVCIITTENIHQ